jgi:hypothetical protein
VFFVNDRSERLRMPNVAAVGVFVRVSGRTRAV